MDDSKTIKGGVINISEVIQSISSINEGIMDIISSLTKDMSKLTNIDTKSITNNISIISSITSSIKSYMSEVDNLLTTIVDSKNINTNSINTILDYYETVDPKNPNKIIKSEMKLLSSLSLVSKFIIDISKSIEEISKIKLPLGSSITIRKNLTLLSKSISLILDSILNVFGDSTRDAEIKNLLGSILPSPETIEVINDIQKNIDESGEGSNKRFIDESYDKSISVTTKANIGILDVIGVYLGYAQTISSLKVPNPILFRIRLNQLNNNVKRVLDDIIKLTPLIGSKKQANTFKQMNSSLGEIKKAVESMIDLLTPIKDLSLKLLSTYTLSSLTLDYLVSSEEVLMSSGSKGNTWIQNVIKNSQDKKQRIGILTKLLIIKHFIEENWSKLNKGSISNINTFTSSLVETIKSVSILSLLLLNPLLNLDLNRLIGDRLLGSLVSIAEKLNDEKFDLLDDENVKNRISSVVEFTTSLKQLATSILLVSALAIVAVPATLVVSLFILSLVPFILVVSLITKFIDWLDIKDTKESILSIVLVCGLFALVAIELVLLQLTLELVKWNNLLVNLALLTFVVLALVGITWIISKIIEKMKTSFLGIAMILAVVGLFLVVGGALLALQYILASIEWFSLLGGLLGLTLVTIALAGVCALIGSSSIVFIAAIAGVVILLATIGTILLVAIALKALTLISFSEEDIKKLTAKPDDSGTGEYGVLTAVIKTIESIGDLLWESDFLNLGTLALVTIKFFVMTFTIGLLFIIATLLKAITTITLNVGVWNPTSTETDGTILGNISAIINIVGLINHHMTQPSVDENGNPVEQDRGLLGTIISWISPELGNIVSSLLNFTTLVFTLMNVGCIYLIAKILTSIGKLEVDEGTIIGKVDNIISIVQHISDKLLHKESTPNPTSTSDEKESWWKKGLNKVKSIGGAVIGVAENLLSAGILASSLPNVLMLGQIVDVINAIKDLEVNEESISTKVDSIINIVNTISTKVSQNSKIDSIDEDKVESFGDFTDSNIKLYKGINDLKTDKVTSLTQLYAQMTEFMNSIKDLDLDKITDALVNKISPALQDINETLDSTNQSDNNVSGNLGSGQVSSPTGSVNTSKENSISSPTGSVNTQQKTPEELKEIVQQLQVITNTLKNGLVVQGIV